MKDDQIFENDLRRANGGQLPRWWTHPFEFPVDRRKSASGMTTRDLVTGEFIPYPPGTPWLDEESK